MAGKLSKNCAKMKYDGFWFLTVSIHFKLVWYNRINAYGFETKQINQREWQSQIGYFLERYGYLFTKYPMAKRDSIRIRRWRNVNSIRIPNVVISELEDPYQNVAPAGNFSIVIP